MSNRLTFSLASLIVLLTFGLVFMPMSVIAHDVTDADGDAPVTDPEHTGLSVGDTHNAHPKPTIRLKQVPGIARGDRVVITASDDDADNGVENQFTLIIDYGQSIAGAKTELVPDRATNAVTIGGSSGTTDFTGLVLAADGTSIASGAFSDLTITDATPVAMDDGSTTVDETLSQFEVVVTVPDAALPDGLDSDGTTENDALDEVEVRIQLGSVATAFSLATLPDGALERTEGGRSIASDVYTLTLVPVLDTVAVTATPSATTVNGSTDIEVTLSATAPAIIPSNLMASDFSVTEVDADDTAVANLPTLSVGEKAADGTVKLTISTDAATTGDTTVKVAAAAVEDDSTAKISFTAVEVTVDRTGPMVTIGDPTPTAPMVGDAVMVEVSINETVDSAGSIPVGKISVLQTPTSGTPMSLAHTYNAGAVTFTPTAAGQVTVTVDAGAVMDSVENGSAEATADITVTAPADPVAVTPSQPTTVNGSTPIEITLTATAPAMVPTDLMVSDFTVTEVDANDMSVTNLPTLSVGDVAADGSTVTLTINTDAGTTGDTTVTVAAGSTAKISFDQVSVMVDRTGPMVTIDTSMVSSPRVGDEVMVKVSAATDATQGAIALGHITVTQDASGTQSDLLREYNANTGAVTFKPTAASTVTVTVNANAVMDAVGNGNAATSSSAITVAAALPPRVPVDVTATPAPATANANTVSIVVTLSATATAPVPTDLTATDFAVMEGTTALTTSVWNGTANTLTITPAGTGDTTVTVDPSADGAAKITFAQVSVTVDRTAPVVSFSDVTGAKADSAVMVTISADGATATTIAPGKIEVVQTPTGGTAARLGFTVNAGVVTFTPTAAGTVTVNVEADAVMDTADNGNVATSSSDIPVAAAPQPRVPVAVTATPAAPTVNGSTPIVVTLGATAPATVPTDLMASDFSVMEGTTALTTSVWNGTANTLTITPAGTGNTTVTVDPSTAGAAKITFTQVSVMVDRTGPMVTVDTSMVSSPRAGDEVTVTVSVAADATQGEVALGNITVTQDASGTQSELPKRYNTESGAVTFTPTAASTVTVTVNANAVMDAVGNGNAETPSAAITVAAAREAVAVTATPAAPTVNGSTPIVVTLGATAPATVPTDLMASDFSVMEGTTALTSVWDGTANTLTITPAGTGDTAVTVAPSATGAKKISFAQVSVMVDRTGPMVAFSGGTGAKADAAVTVTITVTGAATDETIAVGDIGVLQTLSDGTAKVLEHTYNAGAVTFTPDAASTVTVTVNADAVMDAVGNGNDKTATDPAITVAAADFVDSTGPIATVSGTQSTARAFDVTITFDEALGTGETLTADEITVTGGTIASVAVDATDAKIYTGTITPNHSVTAVTVQVNAGAVKDASPAMNANVATPATPHSITVRSTTAPVAAMIASKGYAVFVPTDHDASALPSGLVTHTVAAMPNLVNFFRTGGTIDVAVTGKANHNVIITEIMVAEDLGKRGATGTMRPEASQWIELYNNTDAAISVDDITITFTTGYPAAAAPTNATDRLSNTVAPGWGFEATFADAVSGQTDVNASGTTTVTKMFKSLRRKHKDDKQLQNAGTVIQNGWNKGSWTLTAGSRVFLAGRVGTPGLENRPTVFSPAVYKAPTMDVIFSEVANRSDNSNEWIELKGAAGTNMKKFKISIVTGYDKATNAGTESTIYQFPDNDDTKMPAGGYLLLTDQDPINNELAADLEKGVPKPVRYKIVTLADLPNDGNFLLVLRDTDGNIEDVAGHLAGLDDDDPYTLMWPLAANVGAAKPGRISAKNKLAGGNVYKRARENLQGYLANKDNGDEPAFEGAGFSGIGYDRLVSANNKEHHGTPGYPNGAQIGAGAEATGNVIISEIMFGDGTTRFPQWIEIHNMSDTNGVDLHNWRLYII